MKINGDKIMINEKIKITRSSNNSVKKGSNKSANKSP
jgi:hypothetical protein